MIKEVVLDFIGLSKQLSRESNKNDIEKAKPNDGVRDFLEYIHVKYKVVLFSPLCNDKEGKKLILKWLRQYDLDIYVDELRSENKNNSIYEVK